MPAIEFDTALIEDTPKEVLLAFYKRALTDTVYTIGTPDENLIAEWHNMFVQGDLSFPPPPKYKLPQWYAEAMEEAAFT